MNGTAVEINYSISEGIMNILAKWANDYTGVRPHLHSQKWNHYQSSPKYLLYIHYFFPTTFFYSLKWSNTKKLWTCKYILQWIFNENIKGPWTREKVRKRMWLQDSWQESERWIDHIKHPCPPKTWLPVLTELTFLKTSKWQQVNSTKSVSTSQSFLAF